ncbi:hypothetical protein T09_1200 [Trichinella sp. T9]|nr:hypothetical protein T09_1200 [Trichinella sp. T9]
MIIAGSGRAYSSIDCGKEGTAELADGNSWRLLLDLRQNANLGNALMLLLGIIGGRMKVFQLTVQQLFMHG